MEVKEVEARTSQQVHETAPEVLGVKPGPGVFEGLPMDQNLSAPDPQEGLVQAISDRTVGGFDCTGVIDVFSHFKQPIHRARGVRTGH